MKNITKILTLVSVLTLLMGCITKEPFVPAGNISTDKDIYEQGEIILVSWSDVNFNDRIDMFNSNHTLKKSYPLIDYKTGSFIYILTDNDVPGEWYVTMNFGHEVIDRKDFTVTERSVT